MARPLSRRERRERKASGAGPWTVKIEGRLLAGAHDVQAFAAEVAQDPTATRAIRELHHDLL